MLVFMTHTQVMTSGHILVFSTALTETDSYSLVSRLNSAVDVNSKIHAHVPHRWMRTASR